MVSTATAVAFVPTTWAEEQIEEVVVTGSYIKGSPEDAELPIDVITSADLEKMGSPSIIEMVRPPPVIASSMITRNSIHDRLILQF